MKRHGVSVLTLAWAFVVASVAVAYGETTARTPFAGVRHIHRTMTEPRPLNVHVVEVDLQHPDVRVRVTPSNGEAPGETTAQTTRDYLLESGAQIAINASFFHTDAEAGVAWPHLLNRGIVASDGDVYSPPEPDGRPWPVFNIGRDGRMEVFDAASGEDGEGIPPDRLYNAVSGSERILTDGVNTAAQVTFGQPDQLHPRTAIGATADGKLLLVIVDGRQPGVSEGMTTREVADLMLEYGATDAINLDGGGSTTLVFATEDGPRVMNVPVGVRNAPGSERQNGASLAIFAPAVDDAEPASD